MNEMNARRTTRGYLFAAWIIVVGATAFGGPDAAPGEASVGMEQQSDSTYLLVIYGNTKSTGAAIPLPSGTIVSCRNTRTNVTVTGVVGASERGFYEAIFFSTENQVAIVGDIIQITVPGAYFTPPNGVYSLSAADITLGSARIDVAPEGMTAVPLPAPAGVIRSCYPNPFNPRTTIEFALRQAGPVELSILDVRGRSVAVPWRGDLSAGINRLDWDGRTAAGREAASGVYFAVLRTASGVEARKLVLAK